MVVFTDLPLEIVSNVLVYVEPDDLAAVERVCHRLHDCVSGNQPVHRAVYHNYFDPPPKGLNLDWEREIRDYFRLKSICLSKSPKKISQLPFVYETAKRILSHSQPIQLDTDPDTLIKHRTFQNPLILSRLLSPYPKKDSFVCQSWLFERARYLGPSTAEEAEGRRCACGHQHGHYHSYGRGSHGRNKDKNKAKGKESRAPFCLPRPASVDPEAHARRQQSAELQCLLGMPSLVCPPESSTGDDKPEEQGELEFVLDHVDEYENYEHYEDYEDYEDYGDYEDYENNGEFEYEDYGYEDNYEDMEEDHDPDSDHGGGAGRAAADQQHHDHKSVSEKGKTKDAEDKADAVDEEDEEDEEDEDEEDEYEDEGMNDSETDDFGDVEADDFGDLEADDFGDGFYHHHHHHHHHLGRRQAGTRNTRLRNMFPLAAAKVYDMRENTQRTRWGPFQPDGSGNVDWERLEAILIVLRYNITVNDLLKFPALRAYWDTPFAGSWPSSYLPMLRRDGGADPAEAAAAANDAGGAAGDDMTEDDMTEEQIRALNEKDPYGVTGTWMRIVCFMDYTEFFAINFTENYSSELPMDPLNQDCELHLITMRVHVTRIQPPGPNDHPDYPVVHFKGRSYAMNDIWDDNANAEIQGTVRTTKQGQVHWTTFSLFNDEQRWRSEGIQIGGHKSGRGVVGTWFDSEYNPAGPCGPTAYWKMHERNAERSVNRGSAFNYLLANTADNSIRIVVNINHPFGQTIEVADMVLSGPLGFMNDADGVVHPMLPTDAMFPDDASFSSVD